MNGNYYKAFELLQEISSVCVNTSDEFRSEHKERLQALRDECASQVENYGSLYDMATGNYGEKFGIPAFQMGNPTEEMLEEASVWAEDTKLMNVFSTPPARGISGLLTRKVKVEEYQEFCRSTMLLKLYYQGRQDEIEAFLSAYYDKLPDTAEVFLREAEAATSNAQPGGWDTYPISRKNRRGSIYIGDLEVPVESEQGFDKIRRGGYLTDQGMDKWLRAPFAYDAGVPFTLFVDYMGQINEGEQIQANVLRNILYQILRGLPPYTYQIFYLDPARGGAALGEIQNKLLSAVDGNAYRLREDLYHNRFRLLKVASTQDDTQKTLKDLDAAVGAINSARSGRSIAEYNRGLINENDEITSDGEGLILQSIVIFENVHGHLDDHSLQILRKLADCSKDCGISLIVTSVRGKHEELDPQEAQLIAKGMDRVEMRSDGNGITVQPASLGSGQPGTRFFHFRPYLQNVRHEEFLDRVSNFFHPNLDVETRLEKRVDLDKEWGKYRADSEIEIPIGINARDQITTVKLGNSENAHALLAGMTGCGKSSFLHTIINGVISRYRPEDVQLWLSDYKMVEFKRYMYHTPPHIKHIGSAQSMDYTFSFLDKLFAEYERRLRQLGTLASITEYRKANGPDSMPRILIIVDEFHVMSDHCKEYPEYKQKLERLLKESRGVGMTFLLSDQTCAVGLNGLTDAGRQQLSCRMSMRQEDMAEYNAVFNISNAKDVIPQQAVYEIVIKRFRKKTDSWGRIETVSYYEHNKTIFTSPEMRDIIAARSIETYGPCADVQIIQEAKRQMPDWARIRAEAPPADPRRTPIYLGIPTKGGKDISFLLQTNFEENIISIGPNDAMQASLVINTVESFRMGADCEIYVIASEFDSLYAVLEPWLMRQRSDALHVVTEDEEICRTVAWLSDEMERRRKQKEYGKILVIWVGLADITQNLSYYGDRRPGGSSPRDRNTARKDSQIDELDRLMAMFEDPEREVSEEPAPDQPDEDESDDRFLYNAEEDVRSLMEEGPRRRIHNFVLYPSFAIVRRIRCVNIDKIKHRIANRISMEDAAEVLGGSRNNRTLEGKALEEDTAVYYDRVNASQFMPFLSELEHKDGEVI